MGSLEEILERVQYKFASIIGELCGEPLALSQFAIWVDLRLAEYKLRGSISLDCSGQKLDPVWLRSLKTLNNDTSQPPAQGSVDQTSQPKHFSPVTSSTNPCLFVHGLPAPYTDRNTAAQHPLPTPPHAHSGQTPYTHGLTPLLDRAILPPTTPARQEPDSRKRSASPNIMLVKTEPVEHNDFTMSVPPNKSHLKANEPLLAEKGSISPAKLARLQDGPPPLKAIVDGAELHSSLSSCCSDLKYMDTNRDAGFKPDQNTECLESDMELMASTSGNGSDGPEDLSTSRLNSVTCNGQATVKETENTCKTTSVLQPFGDFSCLRNGPRFSQQWHQFVTNRSINLKSMSSDRYSGYMELLKVAQSKVHEPKSVKEHKMLYKFDLWRDGSTERLIKKRHKDTDPVRFYIPTTSSTMLSSQSIWTPATGASRKC
ncbi:uncharacterized protein LOC135463762 [Liolophura sinensis]|uniref:uncharacterized protein LOC135463762 n=1 Tax=Liolophura sinensis TaxID=3198878 RepID=UPI003158F891